MRITHEEIDDNSRNVILVTDVNVLTASCNADLIKTPLYDDAEIARQLELQRPLTTIHKIYSDL